MSFIENIEIEDINLLPGNNRVCFVCYKAVTQAVVYHDGVVNGYLLDSSLPRGQNIINEDQRELSLVLVMHPKCAATLGQRLISDGYTNRHKEWLIE